MPRTQEPIDFVHLSRQSGGDEALEAELLALFSDQCVRQLSNILDTSRAATQRRDAAHTLKGAACAIGAWAVAEAADEVEDAFQHGRSIGFERMEQAAAAARQSIARCARTA
jgi:HPt (histidine-containing phosphotransfer) domain-containing protein